jgi:hypothetical protein
MADAKLLTQPGNYAVVHLPGHKFPGVVFQGDSLNILIADVRRAVTETDEGERTFALNYVLEHRMDVQKSYEAVLDREGISLPYLRANGG